MDTPASPLRAALAGCCPRCGRGRLFAGVLKLAPACPNCGLDYGKLDVGDGAVVPALMAIGFVIVGAAIWVEFTFNPPFWVHVLLWPPATLALTVGMTRALKGFFAAEQFRTRRSELGL